MDLSKLQKLLVIKAYIDNNGCWLPWRADPKKYYSINFDSVNKKSSVWSAIAFLGLVLDSNDNIPSGVQVCHKCHNKACWNPHHIYIGTVSSNRIDVRYDRLAEHLDKEHILGRHKNGYLICETCQGNLFRKRADWMKRKAG